MAVPCCYDMTTHYRRCVMADSAARCLELHEAHNPSYGPEGATCEEDLGGCWSCVPRDSGDLIVAGCCFPGEQWIETYPSNCRLCDGYPATPEQCVEVVEPECVEAEPDRPHASGTRWTADLIGPAILGEDERTLTGRVDALTALPTRARATAPIDQACTQYDAPYVMLADGRVYVEMCSQPDNLDQASQRVSFGGVWTATGDIPLTEGRQYDLACVHLPWWTEALYRSQTVLCLGPED